jgi:exopolysaccharide production protein ExoZ
MIYSIQYMRAIAALLVVAQHAAKKGEQYSTDPLSYFTVGGVGVDLFFIISGYIMCNAVDGKDVKFLKFMKSRVTRIIPLYWILTSMALVIFLIFPDKINSSGGDTSIFSSYLLIPTDAKYLVNNGWTLSYEFLFYFIFSLCLGVRSLHRYLIPVGIIGILCFLGVIFESNNYLVNFITNQYLIEFSFGILVFYLRKKYALALNSIYGVVLITTSVLVISYVNYNPYANAFGYANIIHKGIPALLFFIGMLLMEPIFKKYNSNIFNSLLKKIGDSSYALYLFHPFSLVIFSMLLTRIGLAPYGGVFVIVLIVSSVISGHLCYLLLEKPLLRLFKNTKSIKLD